MAGDLKRQVKQLKQKFGARSREEEHTRSIITSGAGGRIREIVIGRSGKVIRQRFYTREEVEQKKANGEWMSDEERHRRDVEANEKAVAEWRHKHWPEKYPAP